MKNTTCPSFNADICTTYPTPYSVKCKDIKYCIWKATDFTKINYGDFINENSNNTNNFIQFYYS